MIGSLYRGKPRCRELIAAPYELLRFPMTGSNLRTIATRAPDLVAAGANLFGMPPATLRRPVRSFLNAISMSIKSAFASALLLLTPCSGPAAILSVSGPDDGWTVLYNGQAFAVSWTQTEASPVPFITARLTSFGRVGETGRAFLSTALGTGSTTSSLIAQAAFAFPTTASDVKLFTELTLPAGTYYLSLVGDSPSWGSGWLGSDVPLVETSAGVTLGTTYGFQTPLSFLPSTGVWPDAGNTPGFSIVPEPASAAFLLACGTLVLGSRRCRVRMFKE